jgi:hypothetical protein
MDPNALVKMLAAMTESELEDTLAEARGPGNLEQKKQLAAEAIRDSVRGHRVV